MRILILSPTVLPSVTGNAVTVARWRRHLTAKGHTVNTTATTGLTPRDLLDLLRSFKPEVIHAHHAVKAGGILAELASATPLSPIPLVVSLPGTDVYIDLPSGGNGRIVERVCRMAAAVLVQSEDALEEIVRRFPGIRERFVFLPKSVGRLGGVPINLRTLAGVEGKGTLFFFPAGIRPVKRNLECLLLLEGVFAVRPAMRALFAGPALDETYAERFSGEIARLQSFARWIPPVPPEAMQSAYGDADVILNASSSEGLSNVLLEAAAAGRPVLASDIPANRRVVSGHDKDGRGGLLFNPSNPGDFVKKALSLIDDRILRKRLGEAGRRRAANLPTPEAEAEQLAGIYRAVAASVAMDRPLGLNDSTLTENLSR